VATLRRSGVAELEFKRSPAIGRQLVQERSRVSDKQARLLRSSVAFGKLLRKKLGPSGGHLSTPEIPSPSDRGNDDSFRRGTRVTLQLQTFPPEAGNPSSERRDANSWTLVVFVSFGWEILGRLTSRVTVYVVNVKEFVYRLPIAPLYP